MAKPGDIVAFKSGLHGIEAPRNLAIFVKRERRKGIPWAHLVTVEGPLEMKAEHLSSRLFRDRYDGALGDTSEVQARLRFLIQQHSEGALAEEAEDDLGRLEEALWEAVADDGGPYPEEDLAKALHADPSPQQLRDVKAALEPCRRPGTGRFETAGKGDLWRPWTRAEVQDMRHAWHAMEALRNKLIQVEETEEGRAFVRVDLDAADLDAEDRRTFDWMEAAMVQFIEHDGVPDQDIAGIGGLGAVKAFGMDLHRRLGFLASDWIRSGSTSRSSDYIHFLLEAGRWRPEDAVQALMRRHVNKEPFFEHTQDAQAETDAEDLPEPMPEDGRTDLRHLTCHTIDPPDARDFDDAVGIEQPGDNDVPASHTRLWVHIADVSHYVRPGTHLDRHAKQRATSVYLPGRVLPMLPHRIADWLCSLRDDGDRYALSVALDIDDAGTVRDARFHKSLIRVDENLSYADALARRDDAYFASLFDLARRMRSQRQGLAIETSEVRVEVGHDFTATTKRGDDATQMIEAFMVAANEAVARHLSDLDTPALYRCHPLPDAQKALRAKHQLAAMGLDIALDLPEAAQAAEQGQSLLEALKAGGKLDLSLGLPAQEPTGDGEGDAQDQDAPEDRGFATLSEEEREGWLAPFRDATDRLLELGSQRAEVATWKLLSCMGQAYYTPDNEGHFGLGSTHYCHFTSPIRRYPDLIIHRNLKWRIDGQDGPMPHAAEDLRRLCDHCSDQERSAAQLERRVKNACMVLASMHGDSAFNQAAARINGITPASVFVRTGDGIEARIAGRDLPGAPWHVDEWESMLFRLPDETDVDGLAAWYDEDLGESRQVRAVLGDQVSVRLTGRDVAEGKTSAQLVGWKA